MRNTGTSDLTVPRRVRSRDEVGELYHQFEAMMHRIRRLLGDVRDKEAEKREAELEMLQQQINPHFLQNTLTTIHFLASLKGAENIQKVTDALSHLLHVAVKRDSPYIRVADEVEYLRSYLYIQEFKYTNKFDAEFDVDPQVEDLLVMKLLIQPLVENALIHGIAPKDGRGHILIRFFASDDRLVIRVKDDGVGLAQGHGGMDDEMAGVGLGNVDRRIRAHFGEDYELVISSEEHQYTEVEVSLPLILEAGPDD